VKLKKRPKKDIDQRIPLWLLNHQHVPAVGQYNPRYDSKLKKVISLRFSTTPRFNSTVKMHRGSQTQRNLDRLKTSNLLEHHVSVFDMKRVTGRPQSASCLGHESVIYPEKVNIHKRAPSMVNIEKMNPRKEGLAIINNLEYEPKYEAVFPRPKSGIL